MSLGLVTRICWCELGYGAELKSFYSTVAVRLENGQLGSKYKNVFELVNGYLPKEHIDAAIEELREIRARFAAMPVSMAVGDRNNPTVPPPFEARPGVENLATYFLTPREDDMFVTFIGFLKLAKRLDAPVYIKDIEHTVRFIVDVDHSPDVKGESYASRKMMDGADLINSFGSTVAVNLENGNWGSKYPNVFKLLKGYLPYENVHDALSEVSEIREAFSHLPANKAVGNMYDPEIPLPYEHEDGIDNLKEYFAWRLETTIFELMDRYLRDGVRWKSSVTLPYNYRMHVKLPENEPVSKQKAAFRHFLSDFFSVDIPEKEVIPEKKSFSSKLKGLLGIK